MTSRFPRRRRRRGGRSSGSLAGLAVGAGLMYLLYPRRGSRRRPDVLHSAGRVVREVEGTVEAAARDLRHRARGLAHEAVARVRRDDAPDEVVVERVRSKLGRLVAHPAAISVISRGGHVELSGPVFAAERAQVLRGVRLVRGVRAVDDRLEPHDTAEGVAALAGGGPRPRTDPFQRHWAPRTRLLVASAGTFLVARALFGRGFLRIPAGIAGAALLGKVVGEASPASRAKGRAMGERARRERERRSAREAQAGAWHAEPEGGRGDEGGGWSASGGEPADVVVGPGPQGVAPEQGARAHEEDLGAVLPREPGDEPGREARRGDEDREGGSGRRDPT